MLYGGLSQINLSCKLQKFLPSLKLRDNDVFTVEEKHQKAFDDMERYLTNPPVLVSPLQTGTLNIFISTAKGKMGSKLANRMKESRTRGSLLKQNPYFSKEEVLNS